MARITRPRWRKQIDRELALIEKLNLAGYFLIVWDIVRFCKQRNILVQGRGSAANSAVCYALGITAVDPVKMKLLFERFLSENRGEWPDIDLDLPSGGQSARARYSMAGPFTSVTEKLGRGNDRQCDHRTRAFCRLPLRAKSARCFPLSRKCSIASPAWSAAGNSRMNTDTLPKYFQDAGLDLNHYADFANFLQPCMMAVQDLPRHLGQHFGSGMVVCQGHLDSVVPLEPAAMPGRVVVQWDKEDCADMGIVKVDLLGLGMMAVIEDTIQIIREDYREEVDLAHLPPDDKTVYATLQKADTVGMFQIESRAQMSCLPRLHAEMFLRYRRAGWPSFVPDRLSAKW